MWFSLSSSQILWCIGLGGLRPWESWVMTAVMTSFRLVAAPCNQIWFASGSCLPGQINRWFYWTLFSFLLVKKFQSKPIVAPKLSLWFLNCCLQMLAGPIVLLLLCSCRLFCLQFQQIDIWMWWSSACRSKACWTSEQEVSFRAWKPAMWPNPKLQVIVHNETSYYVLQQLAARSWDTYEIV
jgi:hypothetical protein